MEMTRQYLAGELSMLIAHLQAVANTDAARRDAGSLRHAAETEPIPALGSVTVRTGRWPVLGFAEPRRPEPRRHSGVH